MNKRKHFRLLAIGLLLVSGSNFVSRFIWPMDDFIVGCVNGIGLGLMFLSLYRMKHATRESTHE